MLDTFLMGLFALSLVTAVIYALTAGKRDRDEKVTSRRSGGDALR